VRTLKCIVEGCGNEAYTLVLFIHPFGALQPHIGTWGGVWLCDEHAKAFSEKLESIGVKKDKPSISGLTPMPDELKALTREPTTVLPAPTKEEVKNEY
jgi:hypothetical protein